MFNHVPRNNKIYLGNHMKCQEFFSFLTEFLLFGRLSYDLLIGSLKKLFSSNICWFMQTNEENGRHNQTADSPDYYYAHKYIIRKTRQFLEREYLWRLFHWGVEVAVFYVTCNQQALHVFATANGTQFYHQYRCHLYFLYVFHYFPAEISEQHLNLFLCQYFYPNFTSLLLKSETKAIQSVAKLNVHCIVIGSTRNSPCRLERCIKRA